MTKSEIEEQIDYLYQKKREYLNSIGIVALQIEHFEGMLRKMRELEVE